MITFLRTASLTFCSIALVLCSCNGPGLPPPPCYGPDNGQGTIDLPPTCGVGPIGPIYTPIITNGLNPGDSIILIDSNLINFTPLPLNPGGSLGGNTQQSHADLDVHLRGTGTLNGWDLHVPIRVDCQIDSAPRPFFAPQQSFDAHIFNLNGGIQAPTPDFSQLHISAGDQLGLPAPGHVTIAKQPNGTWAVDGYFDVMYRIDYVGTPTGHLAGRSGVQTNSQHIQIGQHTLNADICPLGDMNLDRLVDARDIPEYIVVFMAGPSSPRFCSVDANNNGVADDQDVQRFVDALLHWPSPAPVGSSYWDVDAACDNRQKIIVCCGPGPIEYRAIRATDTNGNPSTCPVKFQLLTCDGVGAGPVVDVPAPTTGCAAIPNDRQLAVWCEPSPGGTCRICAKSTNPCP